MFHIKGAITTLVLSLFLSSLSYGNELNKLTFITESYPPYNFETSGLLKGIAVDLLIAASNKAGSPVKRGQIKVYPWARGYRATLEEPDHVLFATTRTKEREPLFKWAGPIAKTKIVLLAKNDNDVKINTPEDIAKYTVGTIRDDVGEQLVKALGVPESMIKPSSNADSLVKKLNTGRVDLWAYEENVARWFIKKNNLQNSDFSVVYTLKEAELFYAFSKKTSDDLINQLQKGIDEVKKTKGQISDTLYNDILSEYL